MKNELKQQTISGMLWSFIEKCSVQVFGFIQGIILARLLDPTDFGLIAMSVVFYSISTTLADSGFSASLIRKNKCEEIDYSTVFVLNIGISLCLAFILIFFSGHIANFYKEPLLKTIIILNAIQLFLNSLIAVQGTRLLATLHFKELSIIRVANAFIGGGLAIALAMGGFGVWSLVYPTFFTILTSAFMYWYYQRWLPKIAFSKNSFRDLFGFGSKLLISTLINTIYNNIYPMVIGRKFSSEDLGLYSKGNSFASLPAMTLTDMMGSVSYPVLSKLQDDQDRLRTGYLRLIRLSAYLTFPILIGMAAVGKPFIILLITEKWEASIIYLQISAFALMWYPIHALNLSLLKVIGRSDLFLRLEVIKKIIGIIILVITIPMGLIAMCIGNVISSIISLVINTYYSGKFIDMGFRKQMLELCPSLFYSLSMGVIVFFIHRLFSTILVELLVGIIIGGLYYYLISSITHSQDLAYLKSTFKERFSK